MAAEMRELVLGGAGLIGSELVRQVARVHPDRILLLGRGENSVRLRLSNASGRSVTWNRNWRSSGENSRNDRNPPHRSAWKCLW